MIAQACRPQSEKKTTKKTENQEFSRVSGKNSWGFVNQDKDTIIPLGIYKFLNPIDEENMIFAQLKNGKYGFINIQQDTLISFKYDGMGVFGQGQLAPASLNGKYGYLNRKGEVAIPFRYENESYFYNSGLAIAKRNGKFGFVNIEGKEIIPIEFEIVDQSMNDTLVLALKNSKWAFYSNDGKRKTDFKYDEVVNTYIKVNDRTKSSFFGNGLALVKADNQSAYLNTNLEEVVPFGKYDLAEPFQNKLAIIAKNNNYGIIDNFGKVIIPLKYDLIEHPKKYTNSAEVFVMKKDNLLQFLDKTAKPITDFNIKSYRWEKGNMFIIENNKNLFGAITKEGVFTIPVLYEEIQSFDGSVTGAKKDGKYGLIDKDNNIIYPFISKNIQSSRLFDYFVVEKSGKFGLIDEKGQTVLPFEYGSIEHCFYSKSKRFIVEQNGLFGVIDINQNIIIRIEYDEISNWVEYGPEEHSITRNSKKGLISREGKIIIPPIYDEIYVDNAQIIKVKIKKKFGTINWKNEIIHPIEFEEILWEWPYLTTEKFDTIYLKKDGKYFSTDLKGNILEKTVSEKVIKEKFNY
jgi:hypothetical protein